MVSFSCAGCGDTLKKPKLDAHARQCRGAAFTCIDCLTDFWGTEYRSHTSCMSEAQKYQGALYRPEKEKKGKGNNNQKPVLKAYVEDAPDEYSGTVAIAEPPQTTTIPRAPSPPSAAPGFEPGVNVFDYMVGSETPNPSVLKLAAAHQPHLIESPSAQLISETRLHNKSKTSRVYEDDQAKGMLVQYGSEPVPASTPAQRKEKKDKKAKQFDDERKSIGDESKKDKKRKRLHVDTLPPRDADGDNAMVDAGAPPILHSGLTGGLNRLLRPDVFPPSPDYTGADVVESPGTPMKKSKHNKASLKEQGKDTRFGRESKAFGINDAIMGLIGASKKDSSQQSSDKEKKISERKQSGSTSEMDEEQPRKARQSRSKGQKLLESKPSSRLATSHMNDERQIVMYDSDTAGNFAKIAGGARADLFLSIVSKGPESEKGYSVNKALKRYHRERNTAGCGESRKAEEERELWRCLRLKRNDRGECVVFFVEYEDA